MQKQSTLAGTVDGQITHVRILDGYIMVSKNDQKENNPAVVPERVVVTPEDTIWEDIMPDTVKKLLDAVVIGDTDAGGE